MVCVGLRCVVGVFATAVQGVFRDSGADAATSAVEDRDANAEGSEINSGDNGHGGIPEKVFSV
jgi:hypothetical protein